MHFRPIARGNKKMRISGGSAVGALVVALVVCATATATVGATASACDGVSCGLGTCKELHPLIPNVSTYLCDCYPGWARLVPIVPSTPCYIPTCPSDPSCYSPTIKMPPLGSNITLHPCLVMDCGSEGTCVEQHDKPLRCQCNPGATNMLNDPSLPCIKNCSVCLPNLLLPLLLLASLAWHYIV